jgi:hypothetical protein
MSKFNGWAAGSIGVGVLFVYSGVKGYSVLRAARNLITGKSANTGQTANLLTTGATSASAILGGTSGLPSAGTYNTSQLQALWIQAGGSEATKVNAACHGMQESGGNPQATSTNPDGGTNVGIFQLDTKGVGAGYSVSALQNALTNARITVMATANGTDWSQWSTPGC